MTCHLLQGEKGSGVSDLTIFISTIPCWSQIRTLYKDVIWAVYMYTVCEYNLICDKISHRWWLGRDNHAGAVLQGKNVHGLLHTHVVQETTICSFRSVAYFPGIDIDNKKTAELRCLSARSSWDKLQLCVYHGFYSTDTARNEPRRGEEALLALWRRISLMLLWSAQYAVHHDYFRERPWLRLIVRALCTSSWEASTTYRLRVTRCASGPSAIQV